jgi:hypothetical protein
MPAGAGWLLRQLFAIKKEPRSHRQTPQQPVPALVQQAALVQACAVRLGLPQPVPMVWPLRPSFAVQPSAPSCLI